MICVDIFNMKDVEFCKLYTLYMCTYVQLNKDYVKPRCLYFSY